MVYRLAILLTCTLLGACNTTQGQQHIAGATAAGALIGFAASDSREDFATGALRGGAAGAALGILTAPRVPSPQPLQRQPRGYDYGYQHPCEAERPNYGAVAKCYSGAEQRMQENQGRVERRAYNRGYYGN